MQRRRTPRVLALFAICLTAAFTITLPVGSASAQHWATARATTQPATQALSVVADVTHKGGHEEAVQQALDVALPPTATWAAERLASSVGPRTAGTARSSTTGRPHDGRAPPVR